METKHTAGEWMVNGCIIETKNSRGDTDTLICECNEQMYSSEGYTHSAQYREETRANLKLIAAAPELLEALQYLLNLPLSLPKHASDGMYKRLNDAKEKANEAIKKATE